MFHRLTEVGIRVDRHTVLNYEVSKAKNVTFSCFPTVKLPEAWNCLPFETQVLSGKKAFKDLIKEQMLAKYPGTVKCFDRSCPDCYN